MARFYVVNESTEDEDVLEVADDLDNAVRLAREAAGRGPAGELVSVLDGDGLAVRQFVGKGDGDVAEQHVAVPRCSAVEGAGRVVAVPSAPADRPRESRPIAS